MFAFILLACLGGVLGLGPLGLYLLWLARLNRRDHPTVVGGTWDAAALLAALSGFVLFGGGLVLTLFRSNARYWTRGNFEALKDAWHQEQTAWGLTVAAYLLAVVGGAVALVRARRRTLVVYNVEPDVFEATLAEAFDRLGRAVERRGNLWAAAGPLLEVEPTPAGNAVAVRWVGDDRRLFEELDRQLRAAAPAVPGADLEAARWLMTGAVVCGIGVGFSATLLAYALSLIR